MSSLALVQKYHFSASVFGRLKSQRSNSQQIFNGHCFILNTILSAWIHQWTKQRSLPFKTYILAVQERQQKFEQTNE